MSTFAYTLHHQYERTIELVVKHINGEATEIDETELTTWRDEAPENEVWFNNITDESRLDVELLVFHNIHQQTESALAKLHERLNKEKMRRFKIISLVSAIATAAVIAGIWIKVSIKDIPQVPSKSFNHSDAPIASAKIVPGGYKATLTLANGVKITVDSIPKGAIFNQAGINVINENCSIRYLGKSPAISAYSIYNTLTTPRGGQYQVTLPDSSKAWLNANSSIRYPVAFANNKRRVEITGEVYFEVTADESRPFTVVADGTEIVAIGTHFNVNAYREEKQIRATLLKGGLIIRSGKETKVLTAGKTAVFAPGANITMETADSADAVAWKNGFFTFENASIVTIMQQLSRWYDFDVKFVDTPTTRYTWTKPRNTDLDTILNIFRTECDIKIENQMAIVSSKSNNK